MIEELTGGPLDTGPLPDGLCREACDGECDGCECLERFHFVSPVDGAPELAPLEMKRTARLKGLSRQMKRAAEAALCRSGSRIIAATAASGMTRTPNRRPG
jgi:hypothetical protein